VILFTHTSTPRLQYILDFVGKELKLGSIRIVTSADEFSHSAEFKVNYSGQRIHASEFWIKPHELLFESGIKEREIRCFEFNGSKAFFETTGDFPFDIFAASFYLLSRYEEYLPHSKDRYGRYAHENSLAFKEKFLDLPLVNLWWKEFSTILRKRSSQANPAGSQLPTTGEPGVSSSFTFLPTYDIDIAWSYRHKGWLRNIGGGLRSFFRGDWTSLKERIRVLTGKQADPFDAFGWMNKLHEQCGLRPYYFFLVPENRGRFDKNISPSHKAMQALIRDHVIRYPVGVHPSWKSGDNVSMLKKEIELLSRLNGTQVVSSRQHYIRFNLPGGYRRLIENGIRFDFSMGYGSINGFRASVCSPFYWYDLELEQKTELMLFPFCFMEANAFYEQRYSAHQALEEMRHYYKIVRSVNGYLITIWHNSFLGTDTMTRGWRDAYEEFIKEISKTG
jgi:hypothetical protein